MNNEELARENERLRKEIEDLQVQVKSAEQKIRRAKDISPIERPSWKRVVKLVADACMTLRRVVGGWILKLGTKVRRFKRLSEIWELLITDDWALTDLFPPEPEPSYRHCTLKPRPILRKKTCIAPSYENSDATFNKSPVYEQIF